MWRVALKMLFGDGPRLTGIIMGIAFASLVITQQGSIFAGLMSRTFGFLTDTSLPDLWVMDPKVQYIDDTKPLQDTAVNRVRGIDGVAWAVPMYRGLLRARLTDGNFQSVSVVGLDDSTLIGGPPELTQGKLEDLRKDQAIIVDEAGAAKRLVYTNPDGTRRPLQVGDAIEINDNRAIVVGFAKITRSFQSQPTIYTTYTRATSYAPKERKLLSYVILKAKPGTDLQALKQRIEKSTGLVARTNPEFKALTFWYFMKNTGIPINFGIAIILALVVGMAIAGQTFSNFTLDNLRFFGALKAMGTSRVQLLGMVMLQAVTVGFIGYGIGIGAASLFYDLSKNSELAFWMPWYLPLISGTAVLLICVVAAAISIIKVLRLEPAVVFRA